MACRKYLPIGAIVGLGAAGAISFGCASILGVDDYKVSPESSTGNPTAMTGPGAGGASGTATGGAGGIGVGRPDAGDAGSDPPSCSGATPAGTRMCGSGKTCLTRVDCGYGCFAAGNGAEGSDCRSGSDCMAGMTCIKYNATLFACRSLCTVDGDCPSGYRCLDSFTCNAATAGNYCSKLCSDVTATGSLVCGTGFKCDFICDGQATTATSCDWEAGTLRSGACTVQTDCATGYNCIAGMCSQTCRTNADCTVGGACTGTIVCGTTPTSFHYCI
jgi:hypothetical protein